MIGFFQFETIRGIFRHIMASRKTVPPRIFRIVPFGDFHICFSLNSTNTKESLTRCITSSQAKEYECVMSTILKNYKNVLVFYFTIYMQRPVKMFLKCFMLKHLQNLTKHLQNLTKHFSSFEHGRLEDRQ